MPGIIVDVSSAQHPNNQPINWSQAKAAGVTTAIIKATQGLGYTNPYFHQDLNGALVAGVDALAYHFAGFNSPQAEAAFFLSVAGKYAQVSDIETSTDAAWSRAFLAALGRPATELVTYGSASSLVSIYQQLPSLAWPAAYGQNYPGWGALWQYTDAGNIPGIPAAVDLSRWYGTQEQYDLLVGTFEPPPPPTQEPDMPTSPVIEFNGQEHVIQAAAGTLWWKCNTGPGLVWSNESAVTAAKAVCNVPPQVPQVSVLGNQLKVTIEDASLRAWVFVLTAGETPGSYLGWSSLQLP